MIKKIGFYIITLLFVCIVIAYAFSIRSYDSLYDDERVNFIPPNDIPPEDYVMGTINIEIMDLIPLYTDCVPYVGACYTNIAHISMNENINRYADLLEIMKIDKEKLEDYLRMWDNEHVARYSTNYLHSSLIGIEVNRDYYNICRFRGIVLADLGTYSVKEFKEINKLIFHRDNRTRKIPQYDLDCIWVDLWTKQFMTEDLDYPVLYDDSEITIYGFIN